MSPLSPAATATDTVATVATVAAATATTPPAPPAAPIPRPPAAKPRGNPTHHLAPAQPCPGRPCPRALVPGVDPRSARAGCPCQAPAIHGRLRCRLHGGRAADPNAHLRQHRPRPRRPTPQALLAALLAELRVPARARHLPDKTLCTISARRRRRPGGPCLPRTRTAAQTPRRPVARMQTASQNSLHQGAHPARQTAAPELLAPESAPTARDAGLTEPYVPFPPTGPAAPATTPAGDPHPAAHTNPVQRAHTNPQPKPPAPEGAPGARQTATPEPLVTVPAAGAPVPPPGLPNRAARRRWMRQQRHLHRAPPARTHP